MSTMRKIVVFLLLCSGCAESEYRRDHEKLRRLEREITLARGDLKASAEVAQVSSHTKAYLNKSLDHLDKAITLTHQLTGDE